MTFRTVYLKTTEACNLNCSHCFTGGSRPPRSFWDTAKVKDWVSRFAAAIDPMDRVHFELHGGEPFLAPLDQIQDVTQAVRACGLQGMSIGATSNLTYKLDDETLAFIAGLDGFGTSWDPDIRFANDKQLKLWRRNLRTVLEHRKDVVLNVSVSRGVTQMDQEAFLMFLRDTGCYKVQFDRITPNGNASSHPEIFPTNGEINDWYLRMHAASEKLGARHWFENAALEDVYAKFENGNACSGTFCRDCEERNITLNADGTIGGCPNSAPEESFGHIDMRLEELFVAPQRVEVMASERSRNEHCYSCPVFSYCGSDCHRLAWEGDICASPRQLMKQLAGLPLDPPSKPRKIFRILAST